MQPVRMPAVRIDVAKEVYLECGVDGDDSQASDDLRVVRDLLRTQNEMPPEESYIAGDFIQYLGGDGERGSGGERTSPRLNQLYHRVLQNLAVHLERGNFRNFSEGFKNRIGDGADAGLKRQEAFGYATGANVGDKKFG